MDWKLELVVIPVSDVDRAKKFYSEQMGFNVDVDPHGERILPRRAADAAGVRLFDLDRRRSGGVGARIAPGTPALVEDIEAAHGELVERGVDVTPIRHVEEGEWVDGKGGPWNSFFFFSDPDGNGWAVQEKPAA